MLAGRDALYVSAVKSGDPAIGSRTSNGDERIESAPRDAGAARHLLDASSGFWVERLALTHPRHNEAVSSLHLMIGKMAIRELARRRRQLPALSGPEFDDLAQQAADDALMKVLKRVDTFRGLCRFTTWVYKIVICEVSTKVSDHAWHRHPPNLSEEIWEQLADTSRAGPEEAFERRAQLFALRQAISELSDRQRLVFVSIALNEVPIEVLADELGANRNAIYKCLFDARQSLRSRMAAAGHPVIGSEADAREHFRGALASGC